MRAPLLPVLRVTLPRVGAQGFRVRAVSLVREHSR